MCLLPINNYSWLISCSLGFCDFFAAWVQTHPSRMGVKLSFRDCNTFKQCWNHLHPISKCFSYNTAEKLPKALTCHTHTFYVSFLCRKYCVILTHDTPDPFSLMWVKPPTKGTTQNTFQMFLFGTTELCCDTYVTIENVFVNVFLIWQYECVVSGFNDFVNFAQEGLGPSRWVLHWCTLVFLWVKGNGVNID